MRANSLEKLAGGEIVGMRVIQIATIPAESIITKNDTTEKSIDEIYKRDFANLISEFYQIYKTSKSVTGNYQDISLELLWLSRPVENQPFAAEITLYIIIRVIDVTEARVNKSLEDVYKIFKSTLEMQKYDFMDIDYNELKNYISDVKDERVIAITKDERIENLQNQILPVCYAYDKLPNVDQNLGKIANSLVDSPYCAISFQIIPTMYTHSENDMLGKMVQALDTLNNGIMEHGVGNISFSLADKYVQLYKYYAHNKSSALFNYNIIIYGDENDVPNIATRVYGFLSNSTKEVANMQLININANELLKDTNFYPMPWALNENIINKNRKQDIWGSDFGQTYRSLYKFPYILTIEEVSVFFRLPIGSKSVSAGFKVNEAEKRSRTYADNIINAGDIPFGKLKSSAHSDILGLQLTDLTKHMLVVGTPGSGKTTFSVGLLDQLWKQHSIPFLVIEPAKNEYRAIVESIPDLQIFTPGKNSISPFVFNPFVPPKNVKLESYKSTLKTAFSAAVTMTTPLDKIFEETISNCYSDFRWLDSYTTDNQGRIFSISDFIKCFQETFDDIGYTGDAKNIGRAGVVRLQSLAKLFDNYYSIPIEDLLSKPTVIELAAIENSDEKALIIAILLLSILAYVNSNYIGEGELKNVILLEEAHVLLDASSNVNGDASPSMIAQGLVKRMLAEIRSYGVGMIIADQSPRKVSTDIVALTDIKVAFRLVEAEDKQILVDSTGMNENQKLRLAKLKPGEAYVFYNKLEEPEEVLTENYRINNEISITLSDENIRKLSTYWNDKAEKLRPYPECCHIQYCQFSCELNRRLLAKEIARRIFNKYIKNGCSDSKKITEVFSHISKLVIQELNDEPFSKELLGCVKVHLWRKIMYNTNLKINNLTISKSLDKS